MVDKKIVLPIKLDIFRTSIPMRSFEHAAAGRNISQAVVVCQTYADGHERWGETLPRKYVTGETIDSVIHDLTNSLWDEYRENLSGNLDNLSGIGCVEPVPMRSADGRNINAAACCLSLSSIPVSDIFRSDHAAGKHKIASRVSGVLGSIDPAKTAKRLKLMRYLGLRDFKLKLALGNDVDTENLAIVRKQIGKAVDSGRCTLRVDANGGWDDDEARENISRLKHLGVCVVEQPVKCPAAQLVELAQKCDLPLMADESLLTIDDAKVLLTGDKRIWWNIRISKNGGLRRALALAILARDNDVNFTIGCMVGESAILSSAQRLLLQVSPPPTFTEGNYGKFLLSDDLVSGAFRMGYGGKLKAIDLRNCFTKKPDVKKIRRFAKHVATMG